MKIQKNGIKLAWILISLGLLFGGIFAIFQESPPEVADGWTASSNIDIRNSIIIPDQNDDGISDIFQWINPNFNNEDWNNTNGARIIDGTNGDLIKEIKYENQEKKYFVDYNRENDMFCTSAGNIILVARSVNNTEDWNYENRIEWNDGYDILRIESDTLEIKTIKNVFEEGWESLEGFQDPQIEIRHFQLDLNFIKNSSVPYSSYIGEVISIKNTMPFLNDTLDGYNDTKVVYSFIDPNTLEVISQLTWEKNPMGIEKNVMEGYFSGALTETQKDWVYPYYYAIYDYEVEEGIEKRVYITTIDKFLNNTPTIDWMVQNLSLYSDTKFFSGQNINYYQDIVPIINFNSSGIAQGFTFGVFADKIITNPIPEDIRPGFSNNRWFVQDEYSQNVACQVVSFNIDSIDGPYSKPVFNYASKSSLISDMDQFSEINVENFGIVFDIIPYSKNIDQNATSIVLLTNQDNVLEYEEINSFGYAKMGYNIYFLDEKAAGINYDPEVGTMSIQEQSLFKSHGPIILNSEIFSEIHIFNTIDFDIDSDGITDILLPGVIVENEMLKNYETYITGPFCVITQTGAIQPNYLASGYRGNYYTRSDVNGDEKSDVVFSNEFTIFVSEFEQKETSYFDSKMENEQTKRFFILGMIMIGISIILLVLISIKMRSISIKSIIKNIKSYLVLLVIALGLITILYYLLSMLINTSQLNRGFLVGTTAQSTAIKELVRNSGTLTLTFFTTVPITLGLYILLGPIMGDSIVGLNQIFYGKKEGLRAVVKKEEIADEALGNIDYKIVIAPPFGRPQNALTIIFRVLSVLSLSISIGLNVFNYVIGNSMDLETISSFSSLADPNMLLYITNIFDYLIIPGILAVPLFFWLIPSSWTLDDSGILFYVKRKNNRRPEDVESVGKWFSNYLKGFLGIGAIFSYIQFIQNSPVVNSSDNLGESGTIISTFVFGYIIIAGLSMGILAVIFHDITLAHSASNLYNRLENRHVKVERQLIKFETIEEITYESIENGLNPSNTKNTNEEGENEEL